MYVMHNRPSGSATELMLHTPIATYKEHTRLRKSKQPRAKSLLLSFSALLCRGSLIHRVLPSAVILLPRRQGISTGQGPRTVPGGYRKNTGSAHKKVPTEPHHTHTPPSTEQTKLPESALLIPSGRLPLSVASAQLLSMQPHPAVLSPSFLHRLPRISTLPPSLSQGKALLQWRWIRMGRVSGARANDFSNKS